MIKGPRSIITTIPEGTCVKTDVLGSSPEFVMAYKGHHFDRDWTVVFTDDWESDDPRWESMGIKPAVILDELLAKIGLFPVGFPPRRVVEMEATWAEWSHVSESTKKGEEGKKVTSSTRELRTRNEMTRYFFLKKFPYAYRMKDVETSLGIRIDFDFTTYVIGTNPMIATVHNEDWFLQMEELVLARARSFVGGHDFFSMLSDDAIAQSNLRKYHPLLRRIQQRMKETDPTQNVDLGEMEPFGKFMAKITGRDQRRGHRDDGDALKPLEQILGIKLLDATIGNVSLAAGEQKLVDDLALLTRKDIELENKEKEAETNRKNRIKQAEAEAAALDLETAALKRRYEGVDERYLSTPGGADLARVIRQAQAYEKIAAALKENTSLTSPTIVLPQNESTRPVVTVGGSK